MATLPKPRYHIGIDLGTTHTVMAFRPIGAADPSVPIEIFKVDQFVLPGQREALPLLPSVRYHAKDEEIDCEAVRLPWDSNPGSSPKVLIGEIARFLGARTQGRLIASAKSWLCHSGVDRLADILPYGSNPKEVLLISPVEATASYLGYLRSAWNHVHPEDPLEAQSIVITVPASFDEVSRRLTLEASERAGLPRPLLMEEPQAAFYAYLWFNQVDLKKVLEGANLLLVIDLGGGTLDLSLFEIQPTALEVKIRRVSVGNHLMLGGDNLDHALAKVVEARLAGGTQPLSAKTRLQLIEQCRLAKEQLFSDDAPERLPITLLGSGSRLVGDSRTVEVERDQVREQLLEGFFPLVSLEDRPSHQHSGLMDFGLPYARDPAVTRHLAAFLGAYRASRIGDGQGADLPLIPDTVLLNGGLVQSPIIAERLVEQLENWRGSKIKVLKNPDSRLSVALGAVASALTTSEKNFRRIEAFAPRSFYLRVEEADGIPRAICVLPRGTPEDVTLSLDQHRFSLKLGETVRFDLLQARDDRTDALGAVVAVEFGSMNPLPPLIVELESDLNRTPEVQLEVRMNALGLLDLLLREEAGETWSLEFPLRPESQSSQRGQGSLSPALLKARGLIEEIFGKKQKTPNPKAVKTLRIDLEKTLGPRNDWDLPMLRGLLDAFLEGKAFRKRSPDHERLWLNWVGYCLRPGFGFLGDQGRIQEIVDLFPEGIQYVKEARNWAEWWTLWRRIAGGLEPQMQSRLAEQLRPLFDAAFSNRNPAVANQLKHQSPDDGVRLLGVLERLSPETKLTIGTGLLLRSDRLLSPPVVWALGRIGSRIPVYGPLECIIPGQSITPWLDRLMQEDFKKNSDAAFAAVLLARRTGDAHLDLEEDRVAALVEKLQRAKCPNAWPDLIRNPGPWSEQDQKRLYGESLPPGLKRL